MKLRIHGNSIRLRLNRREVAQFASTGQIGEESLLASHDERKPGAPNYTVRKADHEQATELGDGIRRSKKARHDMASEKEYNCVLIGAS